MLCPFGQPFCVTEIDRLVRRPMRNEGSPRELAYGVFNVKFGLLRFEIFPEVPIVPQPLAGSVIDDFELPGLLPVFEGVSAWEPGAEIGDRCPSDQRLYALFSLGFERGVGGSSGQACNATTTAVSDDCDGVSCCGWIGQGSFIS